MVDAGGGVPGACTTSKGAVLVPKPPASVTETKPVQAPAGTLAVSSVEDPTVKEATEGPNRTSETLLKFAPLTFTTVPAGPDGGEIEVTSGGKVTSIGLGLVAVPPADETWIR